MLILIVAILGQLRLVIGLDPLRRELERVLQFRRQRLVGRLAFIGTDLPALFAQAETVKTLGQFEQGNIATRTHIAYGLLDNRRYIGFGFTPPVYQLVKLPVEIGLVDRKSKH